MKRYLPLFPLAGLALIAGLFILGIVYKRLREEPSGVPPVALVESTCTEPTTTDDFGIYWNQFQIGIKSRDKHKLFSMLRICSFDWEVFNENEGLRKPLASPAYAPYQYPPHFTYTLVRTTHSGTSFVFQDDDDFLANYNVIFSDRITHHLLGDAPIPTTDGSFEIRWRDNGLRTLRFERVANVGYKFAGLHWEP